MSKIIGNTVGTPLGIQQIKEKINPVISVNGVKADENGNVVVSSGLNFTTDETLKLDPKTGVLAVNTTDAMEKDNTLPITSAAVFATVGNIEILLKTI